MARSVEQLRDSMHQRLDQLSQKVEEARTSIVEADMKREADFEAKVQAARDRVQEKHEEAKRARQKIEQDLQTKRAEWHDKVEDWKAQRNQDMLEVRAEDAEGYASAALDVAVAAVYEADVAILEAIEAREDADAAASI